MYLHNVYAPVEPQLRAKFFNQLPRRFEYDAIHIVMGDFNSIEDEFYDTYNYSNPNIQGRKELNQWLQQLDVSDPWRHQNPNKIQMTSPRRTNRIDRHYISNSCFEPFTLKPYYLQDTIIGDHKNQNLQISNHATTRKAAYWMCPAWLLQMPIIQDQILHRIKKNLPDPAKNISPWWEHAKANFKSFLKDKEKFYGRYHRTELRRLRKQLDQAKFEAYVTPNQNSRQQVRNAKYQLDTYLAHLREQKMEDGVDKFVATDECCSKMFLKGPTIANNIMSHSILEYPNGDITTNPNEIIKGHTNTWTQIFNPSPDHPDETPIDLERQENLLELINIGLSTQERENLDSPLHENEFENAIMDMKKKKTPGVDGLTAEFYQLYPTLWASILLTVFNHMVHRVGHLTTTQRRAAICLLFKGGEHYVATAYRPIALLCTDAKIFAKVITKRLKLVIPKLVPPDQSGFVPGRRISHNITRLHSIIHHCLTDLGKNSNDPRVLLFLDFMKAYDRVQWSYLFRVLQKMNFGPNIIKTFQAIYSKRVIYLIINGHLSKAIDQVRGVLQGCPLSPFLFVLQMVPLMLFIQSIAPTYGIKIHEELDHILGSFFADDTTIIAESIEAANLVYAKIEKKFCNATGAKLHPGKTKLFPLTTSNIVSQTQLQHIKPTESYRSLGVLYSMKIQDPKLLQPKVDEFISQLSKWKYRGRTYKGRVTILRAKLHPLLWYQLQTMVPSNLQVNELQQVSNQFVNQTFNRTTTGQHTRRKSFLHRKWQSTPRHLGGLGFTPISTMLQTMRLSFLQEVTQLLAQSPNLLHTPRWLQPQVAMWMTSLGPWITHPSQFLFIGFPLRHYIQVPNNQNLSTLWNDILKKWIQADFTPQKLPNSSSHPGSVLDWPVWNNRFFKYQGKPLGQAQPPHIRKICEILRNAGYTQIQHFYTRTGQWITASQIAMQKYPEQPIVIQYHAAMYEPCLQIIQNTISQAIPVFPDLFFELPLTNPWKLTWCKVAPEYVKEDLFYFHDMNRYQFKQLLGPPPAKLASVLNGVVTPTTKTFWDKNRKFSRFLLPFYQDIVWRTQHNAIQTGHHFRRCEQLQSNCPLGCQTTESPNHLFWECTSTKPLWQTFLFPLQNMVIENFTWSNVLYMAEITTQSSVNNRFNHAIKYVLHIIRAAIFFEVWFNRNQFYHDGPEKTMDQKKLQQRTSRSIQLHWDSAIRRSSDTLQLQLIDLRRYMIRRDPVFQQMFRHTQRPSTFHRQPD